ncbi:hypothetical protein HYZ97_01475 [Candidatus Pacearchaeota archaeon]|nr:hypothetical protein [Candidatus Pacearchaeota archaeon]
MSQHLFRASEKKIDQFLITQGIATQQELWHTLRILLPSTFVEAIQAFRESNSVATTYSIHGKPTYRYCERCLKAHAMKTAQEIGLDSRILRCLEQALPGETGHDGYYLNHEELIKI